MFMDSIHCMRYNNVLMEEKQTSLFEKQFQNQENMAQAITFLAKSMSLAFARVAHNNNNNNSNLKKDPKENNTN